jgi:ethanolamine-phosphate cytidylyltransferase
MPLTYDPYVDPKQMRIYHEIGDHSFQDVNAGQIVRRILKSREAFEGRQRAKAVKGTGEDALKTREVLERKALELEKERAAQ